MAVVVRYFSTTGAGAQDGTSWANRAPLIVSGNWNTIITGFNFAGSDSLATMIGPGNYNASTATGWPPGNSANPHMAIAVDGNGNVWRPPASWNAAMPKWDDSGMPAFDTGTGGGFGTSGGFFYGLRIFTNTNRNGSLLVPTYANWCVVEHGGSATFAGGIGFGSRVENCFVRMSGSQYSGAVTSSQGPVRNVRSEGNAAATSGSRLGMQMGQNVVVDRVVCANHVGGGILPPNTSARTDFITNCVAYNCGEGIRVNNRSTNVATVISNSVIVGCTTGINADLTASPVIMQNNRLRNNGTNISVNAQGNTPWDLTNDFSAGTDAAEFVNAAAGDFRIKFGSAIWGRGLGAGDEPPPSGSGISIGRLISGGV